MLSRVVSRCTVWRFSASVSMLVCQLVLSATSTHRMCVRRFRWSVCLLILSVTSTAFGGQVLPASDAVLRFQVMDSESRLPLQGALVSVHALVQAASADADGFVLFSAIPVGRHVFEVFYIGYEPVSLTIDIPFSGDQPIVVFLEHAHEHLDEITILSTRLVRGIEYSATRVEALPLEEIEEKINMRPGDIRMLLAESTGIQVQQTSAVSGNANFRIQGLDGRYTQLLKDGFPLYSGFSGGLSIMQIPPLDLFQVEVIKGSSSTLYGGGAIAGLVNLISRRPQQNPEVQVLMNASTTRSLDFSGYYGQQFDRFGVVMFATYNRNPGYDPSDEGFSAIPRFDRVTLNPKLFWSPTEELRLMGAVQVVSEDRLGGDMLYLDGSDRSGRFFEQHRSDRVSTQFSLGYRLAGFGELSVKNSFTFFDRSIEVPEHLFRGRQWASFSEVSVSHGGGGGDWVGGLNLWTDRFDDRTAQEAPSRDVSSRVFGSFLQHSYDWSHHVVTEAGLRVDLADPAPASSAGGVFILPRMSMLYRIDHRWSMRLGGGLGYKLPDMFMDEAENRAFRGVWRPDMNVLRAETSRGISSDVNFRTTLFDDVTLTWNQLFFSTWLDHALVLVDVRSEGGTGSGSGLSLAPTSEVFWFRNLDGHVRSRGTESNITLMYDHFKVYMGYTYVDAVQKLGRSEVPSGGRSVVQLPLNSPHQFNAVVMLEEHGSFRIGLEGYYYSAPVLSDGSRGKGYSIFGIMAEKSWGMVTVFANFENIFDTRQSRFGSLYTGHRGSPVFRDIYAPLEGRYANFGVKLGAGSGKQ